MAATPGRWKVLPNGALRRVVRHVPCEADRTSVALVCRLWSAALAQPPGEAPLPLPPQLPWLVRPLPGGPAFSCLHCGDGADASSIIHRFRAPDDSRAARYFGSFDGRWVFVATRSGDDGHVLLNLRTGGRYSIPREFRTEFFRRSQPDASRVMTILAATLSSAPDADGDRCVGAAIVRCVPLDDDRGRRQITFWRIGHQLAMPPSELMGGEPEDVIYHNGAFHFLTGEEQLYVCRPVLDQDGVLQGVDKGLRVVKPHECRAHDQGPHVRYLVESRGELLMVVKSSRGWTGSEGQGSRRWTFMVFQMTQLHMPDPRHMLYTWTMVPTLELDGRMLFVGRGCSRSYEVADFPGFEDGIYFLDDMNTYSPGMMNQNEPYTCSDNGKWSWSRMPPVVDRCFSPDQGTSSYSPPVWLLP